MLLYVLCVSLCRCSFVCVRHSIYYVCVTCFDLDVTISLSGTEREKARGNNDLSYVPSKRKEEIKSGTSGCGSFVVPFFQPATSTDRLHSHGPFPACPVVASSVLSMYSPRDTTIQGLPTRTEWPRERATIKQASETSGLCRAVTGYRGFHTSTPSFHPLSLIHI